MVLNKITRGYVRGESRKNGIGSRGEPCAAPGVLAAQEGMSR